MTADDQTPYDNLNPADWRWFAEAADTQSGTPEDLKDGDGENL